MKLIGYSAHYCAATETFDNDDIEYKYLVKCGEAAQIKTGDIVDYLVKQIKADARKRSANFGALFYMDCIKWDKPKAHCSLLPCFLLFFLTGLYR